MDTNKNLYQTLLQLTLALMVLGLAACASSPPPVSQEEPVIVTSEQSTEPYEPATEQMNEPYEPPGSTQVNEPFEPYPAEPATDMAITEESSGVAPPIEETITMEPVDEPVVANSISETPASYFGIQIVASSTMDKMKAFAAEHGISDNLSTQITVDGKQWYVLLLGVYPTLEEAKAALAGIEGKFTTNPWIRKISSLQ